MRFIATPFALLSACCALVVIDDAWAFAETTAETNPDVTSPTSTDLASPPAKRSRTTRPAPRPMVKPPIVAQPIFEPQVTNQTRQALGFYGAYAARATLSQQPRRMRIQASDSRPMFRQAKPFQTVYREPTVSPYLNLHRDESNTQGAPNYHTFVLPQLNQIEANRMQQREIQQLRGQMQSTGTVVGPQYRASELPGTGTRARYMDTAQFYSGMRR